MGDQRVQAIVIALLIALLLVLILWKEPAPLEKVKFVRTVEPINDRTLHLLELVFNQPLHDGDFDLLSTTVTLSAYTASVDETNENPHLTATMTPSRIGLVAVSRDLLKTYGLHRGQTILLPTYGAFRVEDVMNKRWTMRIDILHATKKAAKLFGVKPNMKVMWVPWDGRSLITSMNQTLN